MRRTTVAIAAAIVLLSSCTTTTWGSKIDDSKFAGFQNGVTTIQDVERALGPPQATEPGPDAGTTDLVYWYNVMRSSKYAAIPVVSAVSRRGHIVVDTRKEEFRFDSHGRLLDRYETTGHMDTRNPDAPVLESRDLNAPASASS